MTLSERHVGAVAVIDVPASLTLGASADTLHDKVRSLLQQGQKHIVVNLGAVSYMDSSGLGALIAAFATTAKQGGTLKLLHLTKRLHDLLVITKLASVFESFEDETSAVASFDAPS